MGFEFDRRRVIINAVEKMRDFIDFWIQNAKLLLLKGIKRCFKQNRIHMFILFGFIDKQVFFFLYDRMIESSEP